MRAFVERIRAAGCGLSLDNFGLGRSALSGLKEFNVDFLKIDGALVRGILDDSIDREFVRAIDSIGRAADVRVIAQGVETSQNVDALREMGIGLAQGYALHKPAPLDQLFEVLPGRQIEYRKAG